MSKCKKCLNVKKLMIYENIIFCIYQIFLKIKLYCYITVVQQI